MTRRVFGFTLNGLRDPDTPGSASPVLFTTEEISLPGEFAGWTQKPTVSREDMGGNNWTSDARRIVGSGGVASVQVFDPGRNLGRLFKRSSRTAFWDIENPRIEPATTTLTITAKVGAPPAVGDILWIQEEAVKVTAVANVALGFSTSTVTYLLTITRAQCGSRATLHRIDPAAYYVGADGSEDRLFLDSRPNFSAYRFLGKLFLFRLDPRGAVQSYLARHCYLDDPPTPKKRAKYELKLKDVGDLLASHVLGEEKREVTLTHQIRAINLIPNPDVDIDILFAPDSLEDFSESFIAESQQVPDAASFFLTRLQAEHLFREPLHLPGNHRIDETLADAIAALIADQNPEVSYFLEVEASGKWLYRITDARYLEMGSLTGGSDGRRFFVLTGILEDRETGATVSPDDPEVAGLKPGWTQTHSGWPLRGDEEAPKIALRVVLWQNPVKAFLTLACSDGAASGGVYDTIIGRVGAGLPPELFSIGVAAGSVLDVTYGTKVLAEREQLLSERFHYHLPLKEERKLGEFLATDVFLLHSLLLGPLQSGALTLRPWARPKDGAVPSIVTPSAFEPEPGKRLPLVRALRLLSGFRPLTLAPEFARAVRLRVARSRKGGEEALEVRIWKPGNHISDAAISDGPLSELVRSWLDMYGGEPEAYEVPTSLDFLEDNGIDFLDFVRWTEEAIQSEDGFGLDADFLLFGININWRTGRVVFRVIEDTFNEPFIEVKTGFLAPSLKVSLTKRLSDTTAKLFTENLDGTAFDAGSAHGGIWQSYLDAGAPIWTTRPTHNADGAAEREGWAESYAKITGIEYDPGSGGSWLTVEVPADWLRGGFSIQDLLLSGEASLSLPDRRPDGTHPQAGTLIEPIAEQLYNDGAGQNFAKVSGPQPFDKVLHKGTV